MSTLPINLESFEDKTQKLWPNQYTRCDPNITSISCIHPLPSRDCILDVLETYRRVRWLNPAKSTTRRGGLLLHSQIVS